MLWSRWQSSLVTTYFLLAAYFLLVARGAVPRKLFDIKDSNNSCFTQALLASQSCSNSDVQYTPVLGYSGLTSEFQWLLNSLLYAVIHRRRLVHLPTPHIPWKYNCPELTGWTCYMSHFCADDFPQMHNVTLPKLNTNNSIMLRKGRKDFIMMNTNNDWIRHTIMQHSWSGQEYSVALAGGSLAMNEMRPPPASPKGAYLSQLLSQPPHQTALRLYLARGDIAQDCDSSTLMGEIDVVASRFLYRLNAKTRAAVLATNRELHSALQHAPYNSLQVRLADKRLEMEDSTWEWMTNTSNIAAFLRPFMVAGKERISDLYVATDTCETVSELKQFLKPDGITIHSSCDAEVREKSGGKGSGRFGTQRDHLGALKLFADVEMLRGGRHFFGLAESNVVRLARRLGDGTFHALGPANPSGRALG